MWFTNNLEEDIISSTTIINILYSIIVHNFY